jgi:hypothetical protein
MRPTANGHRAATTQPRPWHMRHRARPGDRRKSPRLSGAPRPEGGGRGGCPQGDPAGTRQPPLPIWAIRKAPAAAPSPGTSAIPNAPGGSRKQLAFPANSHCVHIFFKNMDLTLEGHLKERKSDQGMQREVQTWSKAGGACTGVYPMHLRHCIPLRLPDEQI